jgi:hypothetical protein
MPQNLRKISYRRTRTVAGATFSGTTSLAGFLLNERNFYNSLHFFGGD